MEQTEFLSKILWDLSNLDELSVSELEKQLSDIRYEIALYIGLVENEDDHDQLSSL